MLYVLDANGMFPIAVEMARFLKFDPAMKKEPIIVGIGYLIGAPYFVWDDSAAWKFEEKFSETRRDLPARVFLTVGLLDTELVPVVEKLDALFRARQYQKFTWQTEYFPGETHESASSLSLSRGIRWLYADLAPQASPQ